MRRLRRCTRSSPTIRSATSSRFGLVADVPQTVVARQAFPAADLKQLIAYVKAHKETINVANAGLGSGSYLCGLLFTKAIGTSLTSVTYKGTGPAMNDLLGGQVDMMCDQVTNTSAQIKAGTIRAYCVTTRTRVAALPSLPPCSEAGLPDFEASVWHGLYAPKGTPKPVLDTVVAALQAALRSPKVVQRLADLGTEPVSPDQATPTSLRAYLKSQIDKWRPIIMAARQPAH